MNRTHLEGAAEKLTAQRGYTFYTGPEGDMGHTVRNYPAAWLAPPELHAVEGRTHGRATYDMTLHLLRPGARISPAERRTALAEMETQMLEIFAELSLYERILAVEGLSVRPRSFSLTPHGEISANRHRPHRNVVLARRTVAVRTAATRPGLRARNRNAARCSRRRTPSCNPPQQHPKHPSK